MWGPYRCVHCGRAAERTVHIEGDYRGKQRCDPEDSRLPYGYNAHPADVSCDTPLTSCVGSKYPDPRLSPPADAPDTSHEVPPRATWNKTWRAPDLGIVDEPMFMSLVKYRAEEDRREAVGDDYNLVSSHVPGTRKHAPIIDLDFRHRYIRSTNEGHGHLYLDVPISRWRWLALMVGLYLGGAIEQGYFWWSLRRGGNFVRRPGVKKESSSEKVVYTHGMFRKLPQYRGRKRRG